MADFNKVAVLILNNDQTRFLVNEPKALPSAATTQYLMPGGKVKADESEVDCLKRKVKEELNVEIDPKTVKLVGEYMDVAASDQIKTVSIKLYSINIIGELRPYGETEKLHWVGMADIPNMKISSIIRNKIIPDLIARKILK